jgi:hypothetical protein
MSETIIIAIIGGAAGIISAIGTLGFKIYETIAARKEKSIEDRVRPVVEQALEPTNARLDYMQRDVSRMRLLDLIRYEPEDAENILEIGKLYFENMHGNSEASKQFDRWLKVQHIKRPEWFTYSE